MQIVIDIPDGIYECRNSTLLFSLLNKNNEEKFKYMMVDAIKEAIPLPENHGDLIDRNELLQEPLDGANYASNYVRIAKAIIPATKGE